MQKSAKCKERLQLSYSSRAQRVQSATECSASMFDLRRTLGSGKKERKKERPTPVARRALRGPLQARATDGRTLGSGTMPSVEAESMGGLRSMMGKMRLMAPLALPRSGKDSEA